ncbi:MAG: Smr/MutS family protein [Deltaproteobacteria bacterium]|nr:Smr/MutS family protein [Deltaproteobacteria bacterium]
MGKQKKNIFNPLFGNRPIQVTDPGPDRNHEQKEPVPDREPCPTDHDQFLEAMTGVTPLPEEARRRIRPQGRRLNPAYPAPDESQMVMSHLRGIIRGAIELDITFTDEYIEGSVRGFSRGHMKRLKRGEFPVQDYIDLHGLTRGEAEGAVREFIVKSHRLGLRCVLIIHGRGLNSPESFPVLKEGLPVWLGRGAAKRIVLAFATARPYDGGTGAVYVLLRKR